MQTLLTVNQLICNYAPGLKTPLSFTVSAKSTLIIEGPSGIGKTTLLETIAGLRALQSGEITGLDALKISMVFQQPRLCEGFTAYENVAMVLQSVENYKHAIQEAFEALDLSRAMHQEVSTLSRGMQQRVSLIRAFLYPADLILMDEPFTGLDSLSKQAALKFIQKWQGERALIIAAHQADALGLFQSNILKLTKAY